MFACVCWTPFQIINAFNYKQSYAVNDKMDLFICLKFQGAEKVAEKIKKMKCIENVYTVKDLGYDSDNPIKRKYRILRDLFLTENAIEKHVVEKFVAKEKKYEYIISSGYLNFNILLNCYYRKKQQSKTYFFDDGMESYLRTNTVDTYSGIYRIISKITGNGGTNLQIDKLYVYAPNLVDNVKRNIFQLPVLEKSNGNLLNTYRQIWNENENIDRFLLCKVVYFDQLGTRDFHDDTLFSIQNRVLNIFSGLYEKREIIIKLHPRTLDDFYPESYALFKSEVPWEIFCLNNEISDKILVAISSTACLTPKLIFDEEPIVIVLYKLFFKQSESAALEFFYRVRDTYREPSRFIIPNSMEELDEYIQTIRQQGKKG